jgi:hypothetical protein
MTTRPLLPLPPPSSCAVCRAGCDCDLGAPGCGHYGCRGRAPLSCFVALASQAAYEERLAATRAHRARLHARRTAWRTGALTAHMLP